MTLTRHQRAEAIRLQDSIGELVDDYLRRGMDPATIYEILTDEAKSVHARKAQLEEQGPKT